jgi:hypothetical protein
MEKNKKVVPVDVMKLHEIKDLRVPILRVSNSRGGMPLA